MNATGNTPNLVATIVGIPQRSWRWAKRCEVRVHRADVDPKGRGYRERCQDIYADYDARHRGPKSALGQLLQKLSDAGVKV